MSAGYSTTVIGGKAKIFPVSLPHAEKLQCCTQRNFTWQSALSQFQVFHAVTENSLSLPYVHEYSIPLPSS